MGIRCDAVPLLREPTQLGLRHNQTEPEGKSIERRCRPYFGIARYDERIATARHLPYSGRVALGAVDQHGVVLALPVQDHRNCAVAQRFFKRLPHGLENKLRRPQRGV